MPNAQTRSINFSDIRVNPLLSEHLSVLADEVSTSIICDEFTNTQAWSAATALATIVMEVINTGNPHFKSKYGMAPKVRRYCEAGYFEELDEEFLNEHSSRHMVGVREENGTHAFNFLGQKGYITHILGYKWVISPRTMDICNMVVGRISMGDEEAEAPEVAEVDAEELDPTTTDMPTDGHLLTRLRGVAQAELELVYTYRGTKVSKEIYLQLKEDGLSELLDVEFRSRREGATVDPKKLLMSLLDGEA